MFSVEILMSVQRWRIICDVAGLDRATEICKRAVMSEKTLGRIRGDDEIVFEHFYNQADDPDYYEPEDWRNTFREDDVNLRWQEVGF